MCSENQIDVTQMYCVLRIPKHCMGCVRCEAGHRELNDEMLPPTSSVGSLVRPPTGKCVIAVLSLRSFEADMGCHGDL